MPPLVVRGGCGCLPGCRGSGESAVVLGARTQPALLPGVVEGSRRRRRGGGGHGCVYECGRGVGLS